MNNTLLDIAEAGQGWAGAIFAREGAEQTPWHAKLDDSQQAGMSTNIHRKTVLLHCWQGLAQPIEALPDAALDPLLRYTFDDRLDDIRVAVFDTDLGIGLAMPVWRPDESNAYLQAFEGLSADLAGWHALLEDDDPPDWDQVTLPRSDIVSLSGSARAGSAEPLLARQKLAAIASCCGFDPLPPGRAFFELLFEDLPVRVSLHPAGNLVTVDMFLHDASILQGQLRRAVMAAALQLNRAGIHGVPLALGLDRRHFLVASAYAPVAEMPEVFLPWLQYLVEQGFAMRQLVRTIAMDGAIMSFTFREAETHG